MALYCASFLALLHFRPSSSRAAIHRNVRKVLCETHDDILATTDPEGIKSPSQSPNDSVCLFLFLKLASREIKFSRNAVNDLMKSSLPILVFPRRLQA